MGTTVVNLVGGPLYSIDGPYRFPAEFFVGGLGPREG